MFLLWIAFGILVGVATPRRRRWAHAAMLVLYAGIELLTLTTVACEPFLALDVPVVFGPIVIIVLLRAR